MSTEPTTPRPPAPPAPEGVETADAVVVGGGVGGRSAGGAVRAAAVLASPFISVTLSTWFGTRRPWAS